jgi:hypothetical protein
MKSIKIPKKVKDKQKDRAGSLRSGIMFVDTSAGTVRFGGGR